MKKYILLLCLIAGGAFAQPPEEKVPGLLPSINVFASGSTFDDGFNLGVELIAEMDWGYVAPELFWYPNLRGDTYTHLAVSAGVNFNRIIRERPTRFRPFLGIGGGMIYRFDRPHPTFFLETGATYYLYNNMTIGIRGAFQYRSEYVNDPFWRENLFLHVGFRF